MCSEYYLDTETATSQETYSIVIPLTESCELTEIHNTKATPWQFMSLVRRRDLRADPLSSNAGASPDNVLLLHKRQNHITPTVLWIVG